jgi:hypothetical protein
MRTTSRLFGTVLVAAGLLAISASAAQAMPPLRWSTDATDSAAGFATGHPGGPSLNRSGYAYAGGSIVFHRTGFLLDNKLPIQNIKAVSVMQASVDSPTNQALVSVMQSAADSPTDQTVPLVISQPVPAVTTVSASSGFDWADAGIGAAVAALLLIMTGFAATRVRPRQAATL